MCSSLHRTETNQGVLSGRDVGFCDRPNIHLLDDEQWLFIRKRFRMSPRELDVARLVCRGLSNEEIGQRLKIKTATVKTHLRNVYRRVRVQRKLDMLLKFLEQTASHATNADVGIRLPVVEIEASRKPSPKAKSPTTD